MISDILKSKPDKKELRKFAITIFAALGIIGGILLWQEKDIGYILWTVGILILLPGLFWAKILGPIYKVWMSFALLLGFVMNHFILALMYYLVFTPIGLIRRMISKDPLHISLNRAKETYWIKRADEEFSKEKYEKMF